MNLFFKSTLCVSLALLACFPTLAQNYNIKYDLANNTDLGAENVLIGPRNGYSPSFEGIFNVAVGSRTAQNLTTGSSNTFIGGNAGNANTTGSENSFVGRHSGANTQTGSKNSFFGHSSGYFNSSGYENAFMGDNAGRNNTTGYENSFVGTRAGIRNTVGIANAYLGFEAGYNTNANYNVFVGHQTGYNNLQGNRNTFVGNGAGGNNTNGARNTFLGYLANSTGANSATLQRATAIGYLAKVGVSNGLVLGDTSNVKVGIGTAYPNERFTIRGNVNFLAFDNSLRLRGQPFLHWDEDENLALGLGSTIAEGAKNTLVLGGGNTRVVVGDGPSGTSALVLSQFAQKNNDGKILGVDENGEVFLAQPRLRVATAADWADRVFEDNYPLLPLPELEKFMRVHKRLPGIPSAQQMATEGAELNKIVSKQMEKIEELTLYIVALEKRLSALEKEKN